MSDNRSEQFIKHQDRLIHAPWEKGFDKILTPFEQFVKQETTSGLILMATALLAGTLGYLWRYRLGSTHMRSGSKAP